MKDKKYINIMAKKSVNLRAQNLYEPETPQKNMYKHRTPKQRESEISLNLRKWQVLWTQHQIFNEPKAPKIIWT